MYFYLQNCVAEAAVGHISCDAVSVNDRKFNILPYATVRKRKYAIGTLGNLCYYHFTPGQLITCFLAVPSVRDKQYKTTAGMYISKSASRTLGKKKCIVMLCSILTQTMEAFIYVYPTCSSHK